MKHVEIAPEISMTMVRHVLCRFTVDQVKALLTEAACRAAGVPEDAVVKVNFTDLAEVTVSLMSEEPGVIPSPEVTTPKSPETREIEPISSPEVSTPTEAVRLVKSTAWTADEDDILLAGAIELAGLTRHRRAAEIANRLPGRSPAAILFRLDTHFKERVKAELNAIAASRAMSEPHSATTPARTTEVEKPKMAAPAQAVGQDEASGNDIAAHIAALPYPEGWTVENEIDLFEMAIDGVHMQDIAEALGWAAHFIRMRFDLLVGRKGTMPARFTREAVLEALRTRQADTVGVSREGEA